LSEVGKAREALAPAEEAVACYRRLADSVTGNPDRYTPDLARTLSNLANRLSEVGKAREALAPAEETVVLWRRLADPDTGDPAMYQSDLTRAERRVLDLILTLRDEERAEPAN